MTVTIELSVEVQARLQGEATRRGITLDQLIAELAAQLPGEQGGDRAVEAAGASELRGEPKHRLRFVGMGASGRTEPLDIHRERSELAEKKFAEGI